LGWGLRADDCGGEWRDNDPPVVRVDALLLEYVDPQAAWSGEPISAGRRRYLLPVPGRELIDEVGILCPRQRIGPEEPDPPEPTLLDCNGSGMQLDRTEASSSSSSSCTPKKWTIQIGYRTPLTQI
jgi:hypothetical protein